MEVPHALNKDYFFGGNSKEVKEGKSFLIPVKPLYFKCFTIDTLKSEMGDGKKAFEMCGVAGGSVNVIIRIPIIGKGGITYIEYQRLYYKDRQSEVSETQNSGGMKEFDFTGLVMPGVRFKKEENALYTVSCVSTFSKNFKLDFYREGEIIRDVPMDCRNLEKQFVYKAETYTVERSNFDFIRVSDKSGVSNIIVTKFKNHGNSDTYEFAVDLGTSNTHIEFKKAGGNSSEPFNYNDSESMLCMFFKQTYVDADGKRLPKDLDDEIDLIERDFMPVSVGNGSDYFFPTRTALSYAKITNWQDKQRTFGLTNFDITYDRRLGIYYNDPLVNIKWSNDANAQSVMETYIRNIMVIIRNKVIANDGDLAKTKITWFYPNSMSPRRLAQVRTAWNNAYAEMFNSNGSTQNMSESIAPIRFYFQRYATATNLVNVDIGGGTTDIAFSSNGKVGYITSFKFAANTLFEDSFSTINPHNGIVDSFKGDIKALLESKVDSRLNELVSICNKKEGQPSNMASFLFSLKDNSATKGLARNKIDFNAILQNDTRFKIVFVIFYTAIIYQIAHIVKAKGLNPPRHIAFSGNGSKIISIISSDPKILASYTKVVFEKVLDKPYSTDLDILGMEKDTNPKEATCKGGLIGSGNGDNEPQTLVLYDLAGKMVGEGDTYESISKTRKEEILKTVKDFFDFSLTDIPSAFNLDKNFGIDNKTLDIARKVCRKDLDTYLDKGIALSIKESGDIRNMIEDAVVFYPIKGVIQALSSQIQEYFSNPNSTN